MSHTSGPVESTGDSGAAIHASESSTRPCPSEAADEPANDRPIKRRRRRILSCEACRRLKCRCELTEGSDTCTRCRTLRIPCNKSEKIESSNLQDEIIPPSELTERIAKLESSMLEIRTELDNLQSGRHDIPLRTDTNSNPPSTVRPEGQQVSYESAIEPADEHVHASPAEVIRKVATQLSHGYRRTFDIKDDLVSLGLLDESTASDLITSFINRHRKFLLIDSQGDLTSGGNLRQDSPFLFSVCCLHEMRYSQAAKEDPFKHRLAYEHVRQMLGQVMLATPLQIEEITGILIMALFATSPSDGPEYLDSWLLSGHCAQQAMLSINFSAISKRVRQGTLVTTDQRAMRVWANICLVNLHWSVTMGRPSTLPASYLGQCRTLLDFEQATLRDAMVFAEISLYSSLESILTSKSAAKNEEIREEFTSWRQKWRYLLGLPNSLTLDLGYQIAGLIMARRSLDYAKQDHENRSSNSVSLDELELHLCEHAIKVIAGFVDIPISSCGDLPDFYKLCVAYSLLVLSHHDRNSVQVSTEKIVQHLKEIKTRCDQPRVTSIAMRFSVEKALKSFGECHHGETEPSVVEQSTRCLANNSALATDDMIASKRFGPFNQDNREQEITPTGLSNSMNIELENIELDIFECMEDFFSGGYLGIETMNNFNDCVKQ